MFTSIFLGLSIGIIIVVAGCSQEESLPFKDTKLPLDKRVPDLLSRMTLEEKVSQMVYDAAAVERLDIPEHNFWNECLHGVARAGRATVFPQAIGLAATWDTELMYRIATAISDEARAKHHDFERSDKRNIYQGLTFWSPNINIFRDPRWGRGMETYGEDPYLTARMAVAFVKGLQGSDPEVLKVVATPKHFAVHSGPEPDRHTFDAVTDERDLRETYLPAFLACIQEAGAYSVMCAYNRYKGEACCASNRLLADILRNEWGFKGYVVSDCGAIRDIYKHHKITKTSAEAAALAVKSGCDLNCGEVYPGLLEAVEKGLITEQEIDASLSRLLMARFRLGQFDPPESVPYTKIPYKVVDCKAHQKLALETARKSIVLLKNDKKILPLKKDIGTLAVIGPNSDDPECLLGNYHGTPSAAVTPLQAIKQKVASTTKVIHAQGCDVAENLPLLVPVPMKFLFADKKRHQKGLKAEYFDNKEFKGEPALTRVEETIQRSWINGPPHPSLKDDRFSVRFSGFLVPPVSGTYTLGAYGKKRFHLFLDDKLIAEYQNRHHPEERHRTVQLKTGKAYPIRLEWHVRALSDEIKLVWSMPNQNSERKALEAAKQADVVIMVMGLCPRLEGEEMEVQVDGFKGGDRLSLDLPAVQKRLIKKIQGLGKPAVLVLMNGSALSINWAQDHVPAIVDAWYPGQAGGAAIADVLFGDYNPAGRLPVTFYKSVKQLPPFKDYNMKGRTYRYFKGEPLYPFGYGLSYTDFKYENLKAVPGRIQLDERTTITVDVTNIGEKAGDEVVQMYISHLNKNGQHPIKTLKGFKRINLKAGETKTVRFEILPENLTYYDNERTWTVAPGRFDIMVGKSSADFKTVKLEVVEK